jgi:hypothetical protein
VGTLPHIKLVQDMLVDYMRYGCSCCRLFISAEPFSSPPCPLPLDLTRLPKGLQQLELRNIDLLLPSCSSRGSSSSSGGSGGGSDVPGLGLSWGSSSLGSSTDGASADGSSQRTSSSGGSMSTSVGSSGSSSLGLCWTLGSMLLSDGQSDTAQLSDTTATTSSSSSSSGGAPGGLGRPLAGPPQGWPQPDPSSSAVEDVYLGHLRTLTRLQLEGCRLGRHQLQVGSAATGAHEPSITWQPCNTMGSSVGAATASRHPCIQQDQARVFVTTPVALQQLCAACVPAGDYVACVTSYAAGVQPV